MTLRIILFSAVAHRFSRHALRTHQTDDVVPALRNRSVLRSARRSARPTCNRILICLVAVAASIFLIYRTQQITGNKTGLTIAGYYRGNDHLHRSLGGGCRVVQGKKGRAMGHVHPRCIR